MGSDLPVEASGGVELVPLLETDINEDNHTSMFELHRSVESHEQYFSDFRMLADASRSNLQYRLYHTGQTYNIHGLKLH
jgi:hypothetical protein